MFSAQTDNVNFCYLVDVYLETGVMEVYKYASEFRL
jgi:hypothetical protein